MLRRILPVVLVILMLLLDCSVLPVFITPEWIPMWTLLTVHCLGLLLGRSQGALYGLIGGVLMDISVSTPLGLLTALYTALGYLGGWFARRRLRQPLIPLLSALLGFAGYELVNAVYVIFASGQFDGAMFAAAGTRILAHTILSLALCWVYEKLLKPSRSRYAQI